MIDAEDFSYTFSVEFMIFNAIKDFNYIPKLIRHKIGMKYCQPIIFGQGIKMIINIFHGIFLER